MNVKVRYGAYVGKHTLQVVEGNGPPLLGRDWPKDILLDYARICTLFIQFIPTPATPPAEEQLMGKYLAVFQPGLDIMKQCAHLSLCKGSS